MMYRLNMPNHPQHLGTWRNANHDCTFRRAADNSLACDAAQGGDGASESWWDVIAGNVSGGARNVSDAVTGAFGGASGWWATRKAEQEREDADAAAGVSDQLFRLPSMEDLYPPVAPSARMNHRRICTLSRSPSSTSVPSLKAPVTDFAKRLDPVSPCTPHCLWPLGTQRSGGASSRSARRVWRTSACRLTCPSRPSRGRCRRAGSSRCGRAHNVLPAVMYGML